MEEVAGTAEKLAKDKVTTGPPPPPFRKRATQSIYSRVYSEDGKEARNKRAEQRRLQATGIEKLGEEEYKKLLEEIDKMMQTPVDIEQLIDKRMNELAERLEAEEKEKEVAEQRKTRPGTSTETRPTTRKSTTRRKPEMDTDKTKSGKTDSQPKLDTKQSKQVKIDDESKSRKDSVEKQVKRSKTAAVPLIEDDDDDDLEMIMDKADEMHELEEEEDDLEMIMDDNDDDDFQEPPPRSRKTTTSKMPTTKRRVEKSTKKKDDTEDETLALFQRIVGPEFEVRASQEYEDGPKDKCGNPVEAAGFRATMKMLARELKDAVRKGKNIEETYTDLIKSTIEVAKAMKYPGAMTVELGDVLKSVKDLKCSVWRKYLKGDTRMEPADVELEDEEPERDLVIQGPILGKEATDAAAEAIHKLPPMLLADTKRQLKRLFDETMQAHQHAAEASKCLRELHEQLPLDVFSRIADTAVRPLVVLHIPQAEQVVEKLKETALRRTQERKRTGSTEVVDVMISRNLPQRVVKRTAEEEYRPVKMIASIVYKYVREVMFKEKTVTQTIVDEFGLPKTTIHRQLFGKKYPGGGQTLEKLRSQDRKVEATGSGPRKIAVILKKLKTVTEKEPPAKKTKTITEKDPPPKKVEATGSGKRKPPAKTANTTTEEPPSKKGKGPGKKLGKERSAKDIRGAATAESEKRKREVQKRKAREEEEEFDEDPDKPTKAEIRASKPASKGLFIH